MAAAGRAACRASGSAWGRGRAGCEGLGEGKALGTRWSWQRERWEDEDAGVSEVGLRVGSAVCGVRLVVRELGLRAGEGTDLAWVNLGRGLGVSAGEGVKEKGLRRARRGGGRVGMGGGGRFGGWEETSCGCGL